MTMRSFEISVSMKPIGLPLLSLAMINGLPHAGPGSLHSEPRQSSNFIRHVESLPIPYRYFPY